VEDARTRIPAFDGGLEPLGQSSIRGIETQEPTSHSKPRVSWFLASARSYVEGLARSHASSHGDGIVLARMTDEKYRHCPSVRKKIKVSMFRPIEKRGR